MSSRISRNDEAKDFIFASADFSFIQRTRFAFNRKFPLIQLQRGDIKLLAFIYTHSANF